MKLFFNLLFFVSYLLLGQPSTEQLSIISFGSIDTSISFRGIYAIDEETVWVSGNNGAIYKTEDSCKTWNKIIIPGSENLDFRDIHVLENNSIFVMSAGEGEKSIIYNSVDSGSTWTIKYKNRFTKGFFNSISFWDSKNGIIVGDPVDGHIFISLTCDGGNSWQEVDPQKLPTSLEGECGFAASGTSVCVYGEKLAWIGMGGPASRIYRTNDMGKSWSFTESPILSGNNTSGIFSIFFYDENNGIVVGGNYKKPDDSINTFAFSNDGGDSWNLSKKHILPFQSSVEKILLGNKSLFISTGPSGTFISEDKNNWKILSREGYNCLSATKDNKTVWLAGSEGRVAKIKSIE